MAVITIVIPAYNSANTISRTLASIAQQQRPEVEVVVVDDGSEDDIEGVVKNCAIPNVRFLRQANAGASDARNSGATLANGTYLTFLDSDDLLEPTWCARFLEAAAGRPETIHCGVQLVDTSANQRQSKQSPRSLGPAFFNLPGPLLPGSYAVLSSVFWTVGGFASGLRYGEHHELGLRLGRELNEAASRASIVPECLVTKFHDRSPMKVAGYDEVRLDGVQYKISQHASQLARDPELYANILGVAGVAAARLHRWPEAHSYFRQAVYRRPSRSKHWGRLLLSLMPGVRSAYWYRHIERSESIHH